MADARLTTASSESVGLFVILAPLKTGHLADTRLVAILESLFIEEEAVR